MFVSLCTLSAVFSCSWLRADQPNVVILFTDDQGTLDVNCYGSADLKTPNMDRLASTGIRFTQAYSHKVCCPGTTAVAILAVIITSLTVAAATPENGSDIKATFSRVASVCQP